MEHSKEMMADIESDRLAGILKHYLTTDEYGARKLDFTNNVVENNKVVLSWISSSEVPEFYIDQFNYQKLNKGVELDSIMDPWGHPYRLKVKVNPDKVAADGSISEGFYVVKVWSLGENGICEKGGGDDIENER